ncbi:response regulator [Piscinibacter sp. HJYY11]|uniref:response regulator n=1 Tax=Piscinibacter sp. HJYY11 TaxID=2801333 RepID=UPI00191E5465|nr:response regulator [Piscinibacter sp. HJYY11]MBL0727417.1 response regulator [Piscinibacter sp. HJYY11]
MLDLVIVVDDNDADLVYTEVVLRARGIARQVSCFDTAAEALQRLADMAQPQASLVLLDLNMPEMDGFAFLRAYEALRPPQDRAVPVVMLTSSPEASDRLRCTAHGCVQGYVVKPLSDEDARQLLAFAS